MTEYILCNVAVNGTIRGMTEAISSPLQIILKWMVHGMVHQVETDNRHFFVQKYNNFGICEHVQFHLHSLQKSLQRAIFGMTNVPLNTQSPFPITRTGKECSTSETENISPGIAATFVGALP